jgi:DTW domain-containing protein YfiP
MSGESRYWLRAQADAARFCTAEALLFLLGALGLNEPAARLDLQFELHVYASLRARGGKESAHRFLETSPIRERFASLIEQLDVRRPR